MSKEYRQQKYNNKLKPNRHRGQRLARKKRWSKTEKRCKKRKMRNILNNHIHQKDWQVTHGVARYYFDKERDMLYHRLLYLGVKHIVNGGSRLVVIVKVIIQTV